MLAALVDDFRNMFLSFDDGGDKEDTCVLVITFAHVGEDPFVNQGPICGGALVDLTRV